jgi:hypothetical protein
MLAEHVVRNLPFPACSTSKQISEQRKRKRIDNQEVTGVFFWLLCLLSNASGARQRLRLIWTLL